MKNKNIIIFSVFLLIAAVIRIHLYYSIEFIKLVNIIPDDASYYFKIAENLAMGKWLTFDSLHMTNGVHPLWLVFITPVFWLENLGYDREFIVRLIFILQTVLQITSGLILYRIIRSFTNENSALFISILFIYIIVIKFTNGLETTLFFFCLVLFIMFLLKTKDSKGWFPVGIFAGLCTLSRLDFVFIIPALLAVITVDYFFKKRPFPLGQLVNFAAGYIIIFFPYLLYNKLEFGFIMPVSGQLKSGLNLSLPVSAANFIHLNKAYIIVYPLAIIYLIFYLNRKNKIHVIHSVKMKYRFIISVLCITVLLHSIYTAFFMKWGIYEWHFALYPVTALLVMAEFIHFILDKIPRIRMPLIYSLTALTLLFISIRSNAYKKLPGGEGEEAYHAAMWTKKTTNPETVFAMKDAGHFAFFSGRNVINLDGLVNSFSYQDVLKEKRLNEYLLRDNVQYIVQHAIDPLLLLKKNEVYRSGIYNHGGENMVFIIWRFDYTR
jgi:Dolichyl-phosphate-mannose-protein mannosyltransferase